MDQNQTVVAAVEPRCPDVMVDIETLGTSAMAVVYEVGMVAFDRVTGRIGDSILVHLSIDDQVKRGRKIEPGTLKWLLRQVVAGQRISDPLLPHSEEYKPLFGLQTVLWFVNGRVRDGGWWWFNGCSFDPPILGSLFASYQMEAPWEYHQERDVRTVLKLAGIKGIRNQTHSAEEDAMNQVHHLLSALEILKNHDQI